MYIYVDDTAKVATSVESEQLAKYSQQGIEEMDKWVKKRNIAIDTDKKQAT